MGLLPSARQGVYRAVVPPFFDARDVLRCPCGFQGYSQSVLAHRSSTKRKKRTECEGPVEVVERATEGTVPMASAPVVAPPTTTPVREAPAVPVEATGEDPFPQARSWTYPAGYGEVDERDRVARQLLAEEVGGGVHPPSANGSGTVPPEISPDGLYQEPTAPVSPSTTSISVALPADIKIMYDWARAQGWNLDDGSIGAFVYDMVSTHFRGGRMCEDCGRWVGECLGLEIYVAPKMEVMRSG
jgi:hypothetical protein